MAVEQSSAAPRGHSRIVVAGDVCIDVVAVPVPPPVTAPAEQAANWRLMGEMRTHYLRGGAMLLAQMIRAAVAPQHADEVLGPVLPMPKAIADADPSRALPDELLERLTRAEVVHSLLQAGYVRRSFDKDDKKKALALRVQQAHGFSGPARDDTLLKPELRGDAGDARLVVLDDAGNLFRHSAGLWPALVLRPGKSAPIVLLKLHRPLPVVADTGSSTGNPLWDALETRHAERLVVVVKIDDLRLAGANIGGGLSWEQTALHFTREMQGHTAFERLRRCRWLIVQCGLDGALCWHRPGDSNPKLWLLYDPGGIEGSAAAQVPGKMTGYGSSFTAGLAWALAWQRDGQPMAEALHAGIAAGLSAARELLKVGFVTAPVGYPVQEVAKRINDKAESFCIVEVPLPQTIANPDGERWSILKALLPGGNELDDAAAHLARTGDATGALTGVPVGRFGALATYDRREIEAYRALSNLIREYIGNLAPARPLCVAVFGPPGSGKSFGVEEVAKSVATGDTEIARRTFNLSQFQGPDELMRALHLVRDDVISGKLPLVFFDEFDSALGGAPLCWLKYLLAPMQDGSFIEQGASHPIGKAIFVFAGGTTDRYRAFARLEGTGDKDDTENTELAFRNAKGPDFVSRLRGKLDIPGIDHGDDYRGPALLRRAAMLRFQAKKKAPHLFDSAGQLRITPGVLRAFLHVRRFEHGVRSLEALLDMSRLAHRSVFDASCLPSEEQMALHVVARQSDAPGLGFIDLIDRESPFPLTAREAIAKAVHDHYLQGRYEKNEFNAEKPSHKEWNELSAFYKDSNRTQADDIPRKLRLLGLDWGPKGSAGKRSTIGSFDQLDEMLESAARHEHDRWLAERQQMGWVWAEKQDDSRRESPAMLPWDRLSDQEKAKDRASIIGIPGYLAAAGYEVYAPAKPKK